MADDPHHPQEPRLGDPAQIDEQAREQTGQRQVRLRINENKLTTSYANAFRTTASAEEVVIDFGMNMVVQTPRAGQDGNAPGGEISFEVTDRIIMNYYTAKRLAIMLSQLVRQHEQRFGELKLNAAERTNS